MDPLCSVIVPTLRRPAQLAECLAALAELDYPGDRYEVIVVDDGGDVPLESVLAPFRDRLRLTLLAGRHAGPAAARNAGAARAQGELLVFTDDDCRPRRDWLRRLADRHAAQPADGIGGSTVSVMQGNPYAETSQMVISVGYEQNNADETDARFFASNNLAFPARAFREVGGFDESFRTSEDRELCSRWVLGGRRLAWERGAVVEHASPLTLAGFWRQHVAYGRGAYRYHATQARRDRRVRFEPSFYAALVRAALPSARMLALLGVWHVANTVGFLLEWLGGAALPEPPGAEAGSVLHLTWSGRIGGIERSLATLVLAAAEQGGRRHRVCFMDGRGPVGDMLVAAGLATRLGARGRPGPRSLAALAAELRRERPDAVHLHTHSLAVHVTALAALPGAARVYTEHSPRALRGDRKFAALYRLLRLTTGRVVAPAPAVAETVERRGIDPARVAVVPHPLTIAAVGETRERTAGATLGVVARLEPQKRVDLLVDTLAELHRRGRDCTALIVGGGSQRPALEGRARELGVGAAVRFAGEQDDVAPWLDRMDLFLMTSDSEPFGLTAIEAMARGVPVVAMPCPGGLADLAAAGGLLLPDRSPATAADTVARLLASPDEVARMRAAGRALADRHSPVATVRELDRLYAAPVPRSG